MAIVITDEQLRKFKGQPEPKIEPVVIEEKPKRRKKQPWDNFVEDLKSVDVVAENESGADY